MLLLAPALLCLLLAVPSNQNPPAETGGPDEDRSQGTSEAAAEGKPPTPPHTGVRALFVGLKNDIKHLPSRQNLYLAGIGGGFALGAHPLDRTVNTRLLNRGGIANTIFAPGKYYGSTAEQMGLSIGTWALGRVLHKPKLSHLGMDLLRAQALTQILVHPIKMASRRERPDASNHRSFPSGHAAITFAAATVIERHLGWKNSIVAYGIASYVAASRLHDSRHYLSDVIFGAAVGSIAGRTVAKHGRLHWAFGPMAVPGGVAIVAMRTVAPQVFTTAQSSRD